MAHLVTGVFETPGAADAAVSRLQQGGFLSSDISILASESTGQKSFAVQTGSKVGEGAAIGAGVGGAILAIAAGLTAVGVVASGGLGLVAAGPIIAALAGAGAGAAAGGLVGGLIGLGIPEHEAKYYEGIIAKGGVLVGVRAEGDRRAEARRILEESGAQKVSRA
ncbi:MAG: hypothetical protein U0637_10805 [Phycisphaerales bacterium]